MVCLSQPAWSHQPDIQCVRGVSITVHEQCMFVSIGFPRYGSYQISPDDSLMCLVLTSTPAASKWLGLCCIHVADIQQEVSAVKRVHVCQRSGKHSPHSILFYLHLCNQCMQMHARYKYLTTCNRCKMRIYQVHTPGTSNMHNSPLACQSPQ